MSEEELSENWREELKQKLRSEIEDHHRWSINQAEQTRAEELQILDTTVTKIIAVLPKPVSISINKDRIWIRANTKKDTWIPHALSKGLHLTFEKSHEETEDHVDYDTEINGVPLKIWNIIPKSCRIVTVKKHQVKTETVYKIICNQEEVKEIHE